MIRVHDPRGFEFEITVDTLLTILSNSDISRSDVAQECVFGWYGFRKFTPDRVIPTDDALEQVEGDFKPLK